MGDQPLTRADLQGFITTFTMTLTTLTEQMMTLAYQMNNANNNGNQRKDKRREPVRVMQGGNNYVVIDANLSSKEEESDKEEIVDHRNQENNHNYRVKVDIPLFYRTIKVEDFLDWRIDVEKFFDVMNVLEKIQVKIVTIRLRVLLQSVGISLLFIGRGKGKDLSELDEE